MNKGVRRFSQGRSCFTHSYLSYSAVMVLVFFLFNSTSATAQNGSSRYSVEWVGEYPVHDSLTKRSFKEKIADVIFGKKGSNVLKPFGVFAKDRDNFWILDQGRGTVFHIENNKRSIPVILEKQKVVYPSLTGIDMMKRNRLVFTDSRLNKVFVISENRKDIWELNDTLTLEQPTGVAWSAKENEIWVVETKAHRIAVLNSDGELIRRFGQRGTGEGEFNYPTFICIDGEGNVYIVDSMNFRLQMFNSSGEYVTSFGKIGDASGYFARPKGIAVDSHGNIYVADALYNTIQIYDRDGNFLYYFGSQGHGKSQFWMPAGIFIDKDDYIYVADSYNARVQIFKLKEE